jgi:hypothetical protein
VKRRGNGKLDLSFHCYNGAEPSDAPKSASGAFCQLRDHRADLVIRDVRHGNTCLLRTANVGGSVAAPPRIFWSDAAATDQQMLAIFRREFLRQANQSSRLTNQYALYFDLIWFGLKRWCGATTGWPAHPK